MPVTKPCVLMPLEMLGQVLEPFIPFFKVLSSEVKTFYPLFFIPLGVGTKGSKGTLKLDYDFK